MMRCCWVRTQLDDLLSVQRLASVRRGAAAGEGLVVNTDLYCVTESAQKSFLRCLSCAACRVMAETVTNSSSLQQQL